MGRSRRLARTLRCVSRSPKAPFDFVLLVVTLRIDAQVHYTGKLSDGKVFDSGDISFHFGKGQVDASARA